MGLIRFILAIGVVFSHAGMLFGFTTIGGSVAVQSFFMISGFYIALILNEKYIGENSSYKLFISNRFMRLYPMYLIVLTLTVLSAFALSQFGLPQYFNSYASFQKYSSVMNISSFLFLIFTNIAVFFQDMVMFLGLDVKSGQLFFTSDFMHTRPRLYYFLFVPQAWSIGLELMFYLIAPFIARKKLTTILLLICCSFAVRMIIYFHFNLQHDPWGHRFFPSELMFFLLGIVAYHIYCRIKTRKFNSIFLHSLWLSLVVFSLVYRYIYFPGMMIVYFTLFFVALPFIFLLSKNWKLDRHLGELSYPIYISHIFILSWVALLRIESKSWQSLTVIALSIAFAIVMNYTVGRKLEKLRQKRVKKKVVEN